MVEKTKTTSKSGLRKEQPSEEVFDAKAHARSGNPAKRGEVVKTLKRISQPKPVKVDSYDLNDPWLVPTMVGLMVLGIAWVVIFYLTASIGGYPLPILKYGNLVAGFALIIAGFGLSTKWK
ncbi:MAG: cell division protein CrgA [Candidatus Ancillula sp.]|jgi:hypothetical protein|nr:cell division protein CrgA [Candidatus Ancillula sp.]